MRCPPCRQLPTDQYVAYCLSLPRANSSLTRGTAHGQIADMAMASSKLISLAILNLQLHQALLIILAGILLQGLCWAVAYMTCAAGDHCACL